MWRKWSNLRTSISMAMSFSMYGISNVASDVCGSIGPLDAELCGRWAQLSAFLPLMRGYYNVSYQNQTTMED
jgi:alpha-glucosidase